MWRDQNRFDECYDPDENMREDARSDARADAEIDAAFARWRAQHPNWREEREARQ